MNPLQQLRKKLEEIEERQSALNAERSGLQRQVASYTAEKIIEEKCCVVWDAKESVTGRTAYVDVKNWVCLLRLSQWDYVLIDVEHLKTINPDCALNLAEKFSSGKFPRSIASHGTLTIYSNGSIEQNLTGSIQALDSAPRVTA